METAMGWTDFTRRKYGRRIGCYASDVTEREWSLIAPFMPTLRVLGRPRKTDLREVLNAPLYIASTGCQWRMLPKDFPPYLTVQGYFYEWRATGCCCRSSSAFAGRLGTVRVRSERGGAGSGCASRLTGSPPSSPRRGGQPTFRSNRLDDRRRLINGPPIKAEQTC